MRTVGLGAEPTEVAPAQAVFMDEALRAYRKKASLRHSSTARICQLDRPPARWHTVLAYSRNEAKSISEMAREAGFRVKDACTQIPSEAPWLTVAHNAPT